MVLTEDTKAKVAVEKDNQLQEFGTVTLKKGMTVIWYDWQFNDK